MHASSDQKRFGDPRLDPGAQVPLPYAMAGGTYTIQIGLFYLQCHHVHPMVRDDRHTDQFATQRPLEGALSGSLAITARISNRGIIYGRQ